MAKKSSFFCKECGFETTGWMGKCPGCGTWNSFVEAPKTTARSSSGAGSTTSTAVNHSWTDIKGTVKLSDTGKTSYVKVSSGISELDTLLGGGITAGSVTLVGGEPGVGKSTLLIQLAANYKAEGPVLYVTGEESPDQIGSRASRLQIESDRLYICANTSFEQIADELSSIKPVLCIVDSIQTICSDNVSGSQGSVTQTREVTAGFVRIAKNNSIPVIVVGHITKDGTIAGPKTIEHMVDTVLYFEGDESSNYRILRSVKNRFGKSGEVVFWEMTERGLVAKEDISSLFIQGRPLNAPGSAITAVTEGSRAVAIEIQALINDSNYGTGQKTVNGMDRNRVSMLLAVIEKYLKMNVTGADTFINIVGGLKLNDPSCDMALISAVISSIKGIPIRSDTLILGEVGLTGELRPVTGLIPRLNCAIQSGIRTVLLPSACKDSLKSIAPNSSDKKNSNIINNNKGDCAKINSLDYIYVDNLSEAVDVLFT